MRQIRVKYLQRGATMVEFALIAPVLMLLGLGLVQVGLVFHAKSALSFALQEAARAGAVGNATPDSIQKGFLTGMVPYMGGGLNAADLAATLAKATAEFTRGSAENWIRIQQLSPTPQSFADWQENGLDDNGNQVVEIPNANLPLLRCTRMPTGGTSGYRSSSACGGAGEPVGSTSQQTLSDANLLKLKLTYGVQLGIPFINRIVGKALAMAAGCQAPGKQQVGPLNLGTPTFQRAPGHSTGTYGLGCALDELAIALAVDPIEMRRRNEPAEDPDTHRPWSSRSLTQCYTAGAAAFGWQRRTPQPRSMRAGNRLLGWGYATATYPAKRSPAKARASITPDGLVVVSSGTQDLGTGTYTVMTQIAAQTLGFPLARVHFELGDSALPPAPVSGGSQSVASVAPAVQAAARALRDKLVALAIRDEASPAYRAAAADVVIEDGSVGLRAGGRREPIAASLVRNGGETISADAAAEPGPEAKKYSMHSFGAVFAEVEIDPELGVVRVPRVVARYGIGKLMNAKTGRSQLLGGVVWGIGMALMEETLVDGHVGRVVNANLAEYHVPTHADIRAVDVDVVHEEDPYIDSLGAKGIGEIGITGVAAAIVNAAYHATGIRVRDLPLTLDKLLG